MFREINKLCKKNQTNEGCLAAIKNLQNIYKDDRIISEKDDNFEKETSEEIKK